MQQDMSVHTRGVQKSKISAFKKHVTFPAGIGFLEFKIIRTELVDPGE